MMTPPNCTFIPQQSFSDCTDYNHEKMIRYVKELSEGRPVIAYILDSAAHVTAISECGRGYFDIFGIFYTEPMPSESQMDWVVRFKFKLDYWLQNKERFIVFN